MPAPTAIPAAPRRHQWHMLVDRVRCRTCDALFSQEEDAMPCTCAGKIRPLAGIRQQRDEADRPPGYDMPPGSRIEVARRRAAAFFGDKPQKRT